MATILVMLYLRTDQANLTGILLRLAIGFFLDGLIISSMLSYAEGLI